jgi:hypothetical protein
MRAAWTTIAALSVPLTAIALWGEEPVNIIAGCFLGAGLLGLQVGPGLLTALREWRQDAARVAPALPPNDDPTVKQLPPVA